MAASRSRSPHDRRRRHRCSIALSAEQYEEIQRTHVVPREWFGDRQDCVPVKTSIKTAVAAWQQASRANRDQAPPFVLTFTLSLGRFCRWIHSDMMKKCNPRVGGYLINQDVNLAEVDPQYSVHPYWDVDDPRLPGGEPWWCAVLRPPILGCG